MGIGIFIVFLIGLFFSFLGIGYGWGDITFLFVSIAAVCGIGLFVIYMMNKNS